MRAGRYDTRTAQSIPAPSSEDGPPLLIAAGLVAMTLDRPPSNDPWERIGPFRMGGASELAFHDPSGNWEIVASVEQFAGHWQVSLGDDRAPLTWSNGPDDVWSVAFADVTGRVAIWRGADGVIEITSSQGRWFARAGRRSTESTRSAREADNNIRAPLPGKVIRVDAEPDGIVADGDPLVILSAMKIEIVLRAPKRCRVKAVHCHPDEQVDAGDLLVEIVPEEAS